MMRALKPILWKGRALYLLEQRLLPLREKWVKCDSVEKVARAIEDMTVRGAPAIGITAAYGVALAARQSKGKSPKIFKAKVRAAIRRLSKTRPTAVNLFKALNRMEERLETSGAKPVSSRAWELEQEALAIHREDEAICSRLGLHGARLLRDCSNVLTHCNTGALATGGQGTAWAAILQAARKNRKLHLWVDETRPYLQGARLTAYEAAQAGISFHLITDNMAGALMGQKKVDAVIVGADRITANGDTANKIGTYALAVLAKSHGVPFYISAPTTTVDLSKKSGKEIVIEQRSPREVTHPQGFGVTRDGYPVHNPAFDVTPGKLISAIVLESGVCRPPYNRSLRNAIGSKNGR